MPEQINVSGYLQLVRDTLDLHSDQEVIRRRRATIRSLNSFSSSADLGSNIIPVVISSSEDILAEWDPEGKKKKLREQLNLTQEDPKRIRRLLLVVDEQIAGLLANQATKIIEHYRLNESKENTPTRANMAWTYSNPMRMLRARSERIGHHLLYESQGKLL